MEKLSVEKQKIESKKVKDMNIVDIEDIEEARDAIREAIEKGELPVITVPKKYADSVKNGISPHSTWIGEKIVAGTLLREPYFPDGEERAVFKIKVPHKQLEPRFTGPDKHFHGVVIFRGPISSEDIIAFDSNQD